MAEGVFINNPLFAGITIQSNGLSGGNARTFASPSTIQLINVSDGLIFLSDETQVVTRIIIFKIGDEMPIPVLNNSVQGET